MEKSLIFNKLDLPPTPTMDTQMHKIPFSAYKSLSWVSLTFDQRIPINSEARGVAGGGENEVKHVPITGPCMKRKAQRASLGVLSPSLPAR